MNIDGGAGPQRHAAGRRHERQRLIAVKMSGADLLVSDQRRGGDLQEPRRRQHREPGDRRRRRRRHGHDRLLRRPIVFANSTGVTFEGSAAQLEFTSGLVPVDSNTLTVGPVAGSGTSTIEMGGKTQVVEFTGLAPVQTTLVVDEVLGPMEIVATDAQQRDHARPGAGRRHVAALGRRPGDDRACRTRPRLPSTPAAGNDTVHLQKGGSKVCSPSAAPMVVNGGSGDDTIIAEAGLELAAAITLDGGAGNDTLERRRHARRRPRRRHPHRRRGRQHLRRRAPGSIRSSSRARSADDAISLDQSDAVDPRAFDHHRRRHGLGDRHVQRSRDGPGRRGQRRRHDRGEGRRRLVAHSRRQPAVDRQRRRAQRQRPAGGVGRRSGRPDDPAPGHRRAERLDHRRPAGPGGLHGIEHVDVVPFDPVTDGYGGDRKGRLVVICPPIRWRPTTRVAWPPISASHSGSHVQPTIDPQQTAASAEPAGRRGLVPVTWPPKTGTFRFQLDYQAIGTLANGRPGLPGDGKLMISVYDASGNPIAKEPGEGDASQTDRRREGGDLFPPRRGATPDAVNVYNVESDRRRHVRAAGDRVSITGRAEYNLFSQKQATPATCRPRWSDSLRRHPGSCGRRPRARFPGFLYPALDGLVDANPGPLPAGGRRQRRDSDRRAST